MAPRAQGHILRLTLVVLCWPTRLLSAQKCFWPSGDISPNHVPCNSTTGTKGSACCEPGAACTSAGYCIFKTYYPYRGSCTDRTWKSANCADQCLDVEMNYASNIVPCGHPGTFSSSFCCHQGRAGVSCCNSTFGNIFGPPVGFAGDEEATTARSARSSRTSSTAPDSTSTPQHALTTSGSSGKSAHTSASKGSKSSATAIGVGVGVPLGVLLISGLCFLLYKERKLRVKAETFVKNIGGTSESGHKDRTEKRWSTGVPQELGHGQRRTPELQSRQIFEVDRL